MDTDKIETIATEHFGLGQVSATRAVRSGHINATAVVETDDGSVIIQELNTQVFPDPESLMENTVRIIERQQARNLATMTFLRTTDGEWMTNRAGSLWRCYRYLDGAATPSITSPEEAQRTARAFGRYAGAIDGLELAAHLPGYHDFDGRIAALEEAVTADTFARLSDCREFTDNLMAVIDRVRLTSGYRSLKSVPVRNAHNDAKGPNCIVGTTGSRTIIDLDTTMPGTVISDIGELVRSSTRHLPDAPADVLWAQIEAVNRGFLVGSGFMFSPEERDAMLLAGPLMAVENAARFLTDHLRGDGYYGADTPGQNLDRAVAQYDLGRRLVGAIEWATSS